MCGIAGIINFNTLKPISESLLKMTQSIVNRGPDDEGYVLINDIFQTFYGNDSIQRKNKHIKSSFAINTKIGFGFRQLKIIDLSNNSHQPMSDIDQNYWIVFNGEIYNFKEIKKELIDLGYTFFSNSDTEVVLNAYKQWNSKALDKFNGMFAFSIYNVQKNELFFARDRIGIKPLYYYKNEEQFIFASTQKAIVDSQLYSAEINWEGLHQNYRFCIAQRPTTCFKNIFALEPAHYLKIDLNNNTFNKKQYWEIPINTQDFTLSEKKSAQLLEESLYNSIKYRLNADVEIGTFMSGGIDSTTISAMASKIHPEIKALTLGFKNYEHLNEVNQASETAKLNNIQHIVDYVNPNDFIKNLNQIVVALGEPYHHLTANYFIAQMAKKNNLKVVLNGLGGDELFGGYDVYKKLPLWKALKNNKKLIGYIPNIHPKITKMNQIANYQNIGEFYSHYYTTFNDLEIQKLFNSNVFDSKNTISNLYNQKGLTFTDDFESISFFNLKSYIGNHQMRMVDQFSMNFSIEGRLPMLDHQFIETAFKIPTKYKIKGASQKYILKEVAEKYISKNCLNMNKKGLQLPLKKWVSSSLKDFINNHLNKLKNRFIFDNTEIDSILKSNNEPKIWQLVSTELWLQQFFKN